MKFVFAAAVVALLLSPVSASAQGGAPGTPGEAACPSLPPKPTIPDPANLKKTDGGKANESYNAWTTAAKLNLDCEKAKYNALKPEFDAVAQRVDAVRARHDATVGQVNEVNAQWMAFRAAYCEKFQNCEKPK